MKIMPKKVEVKITNVVEAKRYKLQETNLSISLEMKRIHNYGETNKDDTFCKWILFQPLYDFKVKYFELDLK